MTTIPKSLEKFITSDATVLKREAMSSKELEASSILLAERLTSS
jgi:hypothetical protein